MGTINSNKLPGKIAFISQSANVSSCILELSIREKIVFSHFITLDSDSTGNLDLADMIEQLGSIHTVESILIYVESITNIRKFMSAARSVSRVKPIIALKSGRTATLANRDTLYDAAFKRAGILRVNDFEEMFDCAKFIAVQKRPRGSRLTIVTNSAGAGVMAVDALGSYGIEPSGFNSGKPVDIPGNASSEEYMNTVRTCAEDTETDALLLIYTPPDAASCSDISTTSDNSVSPHPPVDMDLLGHSLGEYLKTIRYPVVTAWMGGSHTDKVREVLNKAGVITYDTPERGVRAFANLYQYARNIEMLQQIPVRKDKRLLIDRQGAQHIVNSALEEPVFLSKNRTVLTEMEAIALVRTYGISVNRTELAASLDEAMAWAADIGYPVMLRICSRDIPRRSNAGCVILNINRWEDLEQAFNTIVKNGRKYAPDAHIMGVIVQPMLPKSDYELMIGVKQDKAFGPIIRFGIGGIMTDIVEDVASALPPLDNLLSRRLMEETRISAVFKGYRYTKPLNCELVEDMLIRLSRLVTDFPEIEELEINPIMVRHGEPVVTGVQALVRKSDIEPPMHLVISSYPFEYETEDQTIDHEKIFIRPIKPGDAPLMVQHFLSLSPRTVYFRFFTPLKQLSQSMLIRLTQIDYDREIALVALMGEGEAQIMVGVARVILESCGKKGEFSVVLGDTWHGKGIGAALLKRCLFFAAKKGLEKVWGIVLSENRQMLKLAKRLGFSAKYIAGSSECELEIDLAKIKF